MSTLFEIDDVLEQLRDRFPNGDLDYHPSSGEVFISLPLKNGGTFRSGLTWRQARYLSCTDLTGDDLKARRFPGDWPTG